MSGPTAVFAFPDLWDAAYKKHADIFQAIDKVQLVAHDLITATKDSKVELVQLMRALTAISARVLASPQFATPEHPWLELNVFSSADS